ncbi:MAG TPA: EAL domain-containing protein, partial [Tepidisphaeraceae bacterium]
APDGASTGHEKFEPDQVDHVLFCPPNLLTDQRLRAHLAAAGLPVEEWKRGPRVALGELDWRALLEALGTGLSEAERRDTRVALVARGADALALRKALALARPLSEILQRYGDAWLGRLMQRRDALGVHYQPIIQYPPGRLHGYECLVRGAAEEGGGKLIDPLRMFQAARRLGTQYLLDRLACRAAVYGAARVGFGSIHYFVNVMADAIDGDIDTHLRSALGVAEMGGLLPEQIAFEFVDAETCFARDRKRLTALICACREAGFAVSLDDVGAKGATLLPLDDLGPDYVKLDADLCRRAVHDADAAALLREIAREAGRTGVTPIAKGVEDEDQLRFAIDAGIQLTQGHIHAPAAPSPLDAQEEEQVLRQVRRTAILAPD